MTRVPMLLAIALLQGCVPLPMPYGSSFETYVDKEDTDFIEIGETGKKQVLENLGEPTWKNESEDQWVYALRYGSRWKLIRMVAE